MQHRRLAHSHQQPERSWQQLLGTTLNYDGSLLTGGDCFVTRRDRYTAFRHIGHALSFGKFLTTRNHNTSTFPLLGEVRDEERLLCLEDHEHTASVLRTALRTPLLVRGQGWKLDTPWILHGYSIDSPWIVHEVNPKS